MLDLIELLLREEKVCEHLLTAVAVVVVGGGDSVVGF